MAGQSHGGVIRCELWRASLAGELVEDLSDLFVRGFVDWSYDRAGGAAGSDAGTAMQCAFTLREPNRLRPLVDGLAPFLVLEHDDGLIVRGQIGLFVVDRPSESHTEQTAEPSYTGRDLTAVLQQSAFADTHNVAIGTNFAVAIRAIIEGGGVTLHDIRATAKTLGYARTFRIDTSRLQAINRLCHAIGYYRVLAGLSGAVTSLPYRRSKVIEPAFTLGMEDWVDVLEVTNQGELANVVILRKDNPREPRLRSRAVNDDPLSDVSTVSVGREILLTRRPIVVREAETQADLDALAEQYLEDATSQERTVRLRIAPTVRPPILRTVDLRFGGKKGYLDGGYACRAWRVGFTPADALLELELRRVLRYDAPEVAA